MRPAGRQFDMPGIGGQKLSKIAWRHLWTTPNGFLSGESFLIKGTSINEVTLLDKWFSGGQKIWKHMTSLRQIKLRVNCSNFSGVLLTAAHKVVGKDPGDLTTRCGEWDIKHTNELEPHQDRSVNTIVFHPSFNGARVILIQTESIIHILQCVSGIWTSWTCSYGGLANQGFGQA